MSNSLILPIYNMIRQQATQKTPEEKAMEAYAWFAATARTKAEFDAWMADANNQEAFGYITLYAAVLTAFQGNSTAVGNLKTVAAYESIMGANNYPVGQVIIDDVNATSWVVPGGVFSVSVVCVGGGGGGVNYSGYAPGGAGGGLGWKNSIPVIPGEAVTIQVGQGGDSYVGNQAGEPGGTSFFISPSLVAGIGGSGGNVATPTTSDGGGYVGDGGGHGGGGGLNSLGYCGGGGGAGGYSGNGGNGGNDNQDGQSGTGGGGGGGGGGGSQDTAGAGGGVGLLGEGLSGAYGRCVGTDGTGGGGGSSGGSATYAGDAPGNLYSASNGPVPGLYGGGGASSDVTSDFLPPGAQGAIRIIWPGNERLFPSTRTADE